MLNSNLKVKLTLCEAKKKVSGLRVSSHTQASAFLVFFFFFAMKQCPIENLPRSVLKQLFHIEDDVLYKFMVNNHSQ